MKIYFILILFIITSCNANKSIITNEKIVYKDRYVNKIQSDSIYISKHDTMFIKNDTVYLKSIEYKYKYKLKLDTIIKTDSIYITKDKIIKIEPSFWSIMWYYIKGGIIGIIISIILFILYKILL